MQILFKTVLRSQFRKAVKTTCRILQILQSVSSDQRDRTVPYLQGALSFFFGQTEGINAVSGCLAHTDMAVLVLMAFGTKRHRVDRRGPRQLETVMSARGATAGAARSPPLSISNDGSQRRWKRSQAVLQSL